jgi:hypothetical protein
MRQKFEALCWHSMSLASNLFLVRAAGAAAAEHLGSGHRDRRDGAVGELCLNQVTNSAC